MPIARGSKISLNFLQNVLDVSEDAIVCTGDHHEVIWINSKAQDLFGVPLSDLQNSTWDQFLAPGSKEEYLKTLEAISIDTPPDNNQPLQLEFIGIGRRQGTSTAQVQIKKLKFKNAWLAVHFIRALNPTGISFSHPYKNPEKSGAASELQDFSYILAHESSDPLRKIIAFSERLDRGYGNQLDEKGKKYLGCMGKAVKKFQKLVDDLKDFSRISTKPGEMCFVPLGDIVADVITEFEAILYQTNSRIHVNSLPILQADSRQMRMLFRQLLSNSLKFRRKNQSVQVTLESREKEPGLWEIVLKDNGIGFNNEYAERIFSPCERLHGNGEFKGTGMGLTICRKIAARHSGTLTGQGRPGKGATFKLTLPEGIPGSQWLLPEKGLNGVR